MQTTERNAVQADRTAEPPVVEEPQESEVPLERLEADLTEVASHLNSGTYRFLQLLGEFDRRGGWGDSPSCAQWLNWRLGISLPTAYDHVRVARRLSELPETSAAFARGELSYSKVRALTRVATAANEESLVDMARHSTAAQIESLVGAYRGVLRVVEREGDEPTPHPRRYLQTFFDEDGSLVISGRLAPEDGALVQTALKAAGRALLGDSDTHTDVAVSDLPDYSAEESGPLPCEPDGEARVAAADALVAMAETVLEHGPAARKGGDRHLVVLHADIAQLAGDGTGHEGACVLQGGPALDPRGRPTARL